MVGLPGSRTHQSCWQGHSSRVETPGLAGWPWIEVSTLPGLPSPACLLPSLLVSCSIARAALLVRGSAVGTQNPSMNSRTHSSLVHHPPPMRTTRSRWPSRPSTAHLRRVRLLGLFPSRVRKRSAVNAMGNRVGFLLLMRVSLIP